MSESLEPHISRRRSTAPPPPGLFEAPVEGLTVREQSRIRAEKKAQMAEDTRREGIKAVHNEALRLDAELEHLLLVDASTTDRPALLARLHLLETLSSGQEISSEEDKKIEGGLPISRGRVLVRTFVSSYDASKTFKRKDGKIIRKKAESQSEQKAVVKSESSEQAYCVDGRRGPSVLESHFKGGRQTLEPRAIEDTTDRGAIKDLARDYPIVLRRMRKRYGLKKVEDLPLSTDGSSLSPHYLERGAPTKREYIFNRVDLLLGFDVTATVALRTTEGDSDLMAVLEWVKDHDGVRELSESDWKNGLAHIDAADFSSQAECRRTLRKSLIRLACLDYLLVSTDRHVDNLLFDPLSGKVKGIDNSFCLPLSMQSDDTDSSFSIPATPFVSAPLEIIDRYRDNPEWTLDKEALASVQELYADGEAYFAHTPESISSSLGDNGSSFEYIAKQFRFAYRNEEIAQIELKDFFKRLEYIVKHGRPPSIGELPSKRWPLAEAAARKAEEEKKKALAEAASIDAGWEIDAPQDRAVN